MGCQTLERLRHQFHHGRRENADHLIAGLGGIRQRSNDVEDRLHLQLRARRHHVLHGAVKTGSEQKSNADAGDRLPQAAGSAVGPLQPDAMHAG